MAAISFFFMFSRLGFRSWFINSISPYVLGAYLFHDHPLMRSYLIEHLYALSLDTPLLLHFAQLALVTLLVFTAGYLIDRQREYLLSPLLAYLMHKWKLMQLEHIFPAKPTIPASGFLSTASKINSTASKINRPGGLPTVY
jgi:hypothetical protein